MLKTLVPNFFDKEKYVLHYDVLQFCLRQGLKLRNTSCIRIQSITLSKSIFKFTKPKSIDAQNMVTKMETRCTNNEQCCMQWKYNGDTMEKK